MAMTDGEMLKCRDIGALAQATWKPLDDSVVEVRMMTYALRKRVREADRKDES